MAILSAGQNKVISLGNKVDSQVLVLLLTRYGFKRFAWKQTILCNMSEKCTHISKLTNDFLCLVI